MRGLAAAATHHLLGRDRRKISVYVKHWISASLVTIVKQRAAKAIDPTLPPVSLVSLGGRRGRTISARIIRHHRGPTPALSSMLRV